jgi:hypothetical protein
MALLYKGCAASFRTLGTAATPHNLFSIENTAGSAVVISIKRLVVQMDATAVLTGVMPQVKTSRPTAIPSGGTTLNKGSFDTSLTSAANVIIRGANASDGGVATAITATAGDTLWQQYCMRLHTAVGQVLALDNPVIPTLCETTPILLAANQALLVQIVASAGASNPATNFWFAQAYWEENG